MATTTTNPNAVTEWHWVITLQIHTGGANYAMTTHSGVYGAPESMSRQQIFADLLDQALQNLPQHLQGGGWSVVFWSLDRN